MYHVHEKWARGKSSLWMKISSIIPATHTQQRQRLHFFAGGYSLALACEGGFVENFPGLTWTWKFSSLLSIFLLLFSIHIATVGGERELKVQVRSNRAIRHWIYCVYERSGERVRCLHVVVSKLRWGGVVVQYCEIKLFFEGGKIDSERARVQLCLWVCEDENLMKASTVVVVFVGNFASLYIPGTCAHSIHATIFPTIIHPPLCRVLTLYLTFIPSRFPLSPPAAAPLLHSLVIIIKQPSVVIHTNFHIALALNAFTRSRSHRNKVFLSQSRKIALTLSENFHLETEKNLQFGEIFRRYSVRRDIVKQLSCSFDDIPQKKKLFKNYIKKRKRKRKAFSFNKTKKKVFHLFSLLLLFSIRKRKIIKLLWSEFMH